MKLLQNCSAWTVAADRLQSALEKHPKVECPVTHRFTPGLYIRELHVPHGTLVITKIHKTEHPFVVSQGKLRVLTEKGGCEIIEAPHTGITKPGTRRIALAIEDVIWTTFHPTALTDVDEIEDLIIEKRDVGDISDMKLVRLLVAGGVE